MQRVINKNTGCSAAGIGQYPRNVNLKHTSAQADKESTKDTESAQKPEGEASVMKHAAWDGKIYFRQYSKEDTETGALCGLFGALPDTGKELMCMDADGVVTQMGMDYGCEGMYIAEGRIYSQIFTQEDGYRVYSCALNGSDVKSYGAANILAVQGSRVICQMKETMRPEPKR